MEKGEERSVTLRISGNVAAGTVAGTAGTEIDAYTYLRAVWNNELQPTHIRMRAAAIGIEFERPRLAMQATVTGQDFATLLDERLKRMEQAKLIDAKANDREAPQVEIKRPLAHTLDKRYRRI